MSQWNALLESKLKKKMCWTIITLCHQLQTHNFLIHVVLFQELSSDFRELCRDRREWKQTPFKNNTLEPVVAVLAGLFRGLQSLRRPARVTNIAFLIEQHQWKGRVAYRTDGILDVGEEATRLKGGRTVGKEGWLISIRLEEGEEGIEEEEKG